MHVLDIVSKNLISLRSGQTALLSSHLFSSLTVIRKRILSSSSSSSSILSATSNNSVNSSSSSSSDPSLPSSSLASSSSSSLLAIDVLSPLLQIITSPTCSGPITLTAIKSIISVISPIPSSAVSTLGLPGDANCYYSVAPPTSSSPSSTYSIKSILQALLICKFEQTDSSSDESVELAIADLSTLCLRIDSLSSTSTTSSSSSTTTTSTTSILPPKLVFDIFHSIFLTRNSYVHSSALVHHASRSLSLLISTLFSTRTRSAALSADAQPPSNSNSSFYYAPACDLIFAFLCEQLLHTPLLLSPLSSSSSSSSMNNNTSNRQDYNYNTSKPRRDTNEAQNEHDANRILCLELVSSVITSSSSSDNDQSLSTTFPSSLLDLIRGPLFQSLIVLFQVVSLPPSNSSTSTSSNTSSSSSALPSTFLPLPVLSSALTLLHVIFSTPSLYINLKLQLEQTFNTLFIRTLYCLIDRPLSNDVNVNSNYDYLACDEVLDGYAEVVLECLVDVMCLPQCVLSSVGSSSGGSSSSNNRVSNSSSNKRTTQTPPLSSSSLLTTLYTNYDCSTQSSDIMSNLVLALSQCSGSFKSQTFNAGPRQFFTSSSSSSSSTESDGDEGTGKRKSDGSGSDVSSSLSTSTSSSTVTSTVSNVNESDGAAKDEKHNRSGSVSVSVAEPCRPVPRRLRVLCMEGLVGCIGNMCNVEEEEEMEMDHFEHDQSDADADNTNVESQSPLLTETTNLFLSKRGKKLTTTGALLFNSKPLTGIEFLQSSNVLPTPITPISVANFLRTGISVGLDKTVVGAFLGDIGKSEEQAKKSKRAVHLSETSKFHTDLLVAYSKMFHFEGTKLLSGLRMFLTAFRLPGEAQQIDRIIQSFADAISTQCLEASYTYTAGIGSGSGSGSGSSDNKNKVGVGVGVGDPNMKSRVFSKDVKKATDTVYLLAFSIIMLNTDLHNPNVRVDRKMSVSAFIRNNSDYGPEIMDKDVPLPHWILEEIFEEIKGEEIITKADGPKGDMTSDRWKDAVRSAKHAGVERLRFKDPRDFNNMQINRQITAQIWRPVLSAACANLLSRDSTPMERKTGGELCSMLGRVAGIYGMDVVVDGIVGTLCCYTGLLSVGGNASVGQGQSQAVSPFLNWFEESGLQKGMWSIPIHRPPTSTPGSGSRSSSNSSSNDTDHWGDRSTDDLLFPTPSGVAFANSMNKQIACCSAIQMGLSMGFYMVEVHSWKFIIKLLFSLRELKLLGGRGMLKESDEDLLNREERAMFDGVLFEQCEDGEDERRRSSSALLRSNGEGGGILSAIGSLFFGGGGGYEEEEEEEENDESVIEARAKARRKLRNLSEVDYIWDLSAASSDENEDEVNPSSSSSTFAASLSLSRSSSAGSSAPASASTTPPSSSSGANSANGGTLTPPLRPSVDQQHQHQQQQALADNNNNNNNANTSMPMRMITNRRSARKLSKRASLRRQLSAHCNFQELIRMTKFLPIEALTAFMNALAETVKEGANEAEGGGERGKSSSSATQASAAAAASAKGPSSPQQPQQHQHQHPLNSNFAIDPTLDEHIVGGSLKTAQELIRSCTLVASSKPLTQGSAAYAEVLLCEIALRNKDRIADLWPMLERHYRTRLGDAKRCTFGVEKCATGLLRLIARLADRVGMMEPMLMSLKLLLPPLAKAEVAGMLTKHVIEGVWRLCCAHVGALAEASEECWGVVFETIEVCASRFDVDSCDSGENRYANEGEGEVGKERNGSENGNANEGDDDDDGGRERENMNGIRSDNFNFNDQASLADFVSDRCSVLVKAFRTLSLILQSPELKTKVPFGIVRPICALIRTASGVGASDGQGQDSSTEEWDFRTKVAIAGLDLLVVLHSRLGDGLEQSQYHDSDANGANGSNDVRALSNRWTPILEALGEIATGAGVTTVRQHALTLLADAIIDRHGRAIPPSTLLSILKTVCVPVATARIGDILGLDPKDLVECHGDVDSEMQLAVALVFKPLLHHLQTLMEEQMGFDDLWERALAVAMLLLTVDAVKGEKEKENDSSADSPADADADADIHADSREYCLEHVKNAILVMYACSDGHISKSVERISIEKLNAFSWIQGDKLAILQFHDGRGGGERITSPFKQAVEIKVVEAEDGGGDAVVPVREKGKGIGEEEDNIDKRGEKGEGRADDQDLPA